MPSDPLAKCSAKLAAQNIVSPKQNLQLIFTVVKSNSGRKAMSAACIGVGHRIGHGVEATVLNKVCVLEALSHAVKLSL